MSLFLDADGLYALVVILVIFLFLFVDVLVMFLSLVVDGIGKICIE